MRQASPRRSDEEVPLLPIPFNDNPISSCNNNTSVTNSRLVLAIHMSLFLLSILFSSVLFLVRSDHPILVSGYTEGQSTCILSYLRALQGNNAFPSVTTDSERVALLMNCTPSVNLHLAVSECRRMPQPELPLRSMNIDCRYKEQEPPVPLGDCRNRTIAVDPKNITFTFIRELDVKEVDIFTSQEIDALVQSIQYNYHEPSDFNNLKSNVLQSSVAPLEELIYYRAMTDWITVIFDPQRLILNGLTGRLLKYRFMSTDFAYHWKFIPRIVVTDDRGWLRGRFCVLTANRLERE